MTSSPRFSLAAYLDERRKIVDEALEGCLPGEDLFPPEIFRAMRHSVFAGGKRIRPILCIAAAEAVGGAADRVMPAACAIELIHTYSLIHDDLPSMDDDDYRRGKPSCHKAFGEAVAILAGDALLTESFRLLTAGGAPPERTLRVVGEIAEAAGWRGMIGGQVADIGAEASRMDEDILHYIHTHKTAALIAVSLRAGAILAGAGERELVALTRYGNAVGLAFQIADDILDAKTDGRAAGEGTHDAKGKVTYPALYGIEASRRRARTLADEAVAALAFFDERAMPLCMIAAYVVERDA